ncbi:GPR endopeptidase [Sulfoacidibacillus thermotolerans]|uniref:GPR endopeptidase n=1 Tax=Sulfoacidibacillus thermotolerans TaxID=1765684 RepID=UPI000D696B20
MRRWSRGNHQLKRLQKGSFSGSDSKENEEIPFYSVRTDLAIEANELLGENAHIRGIQMENDEEPQIHITRLEVKTLAAAKQIGKLQGKYVTLEVPDLRKKDPDLQDRVANRFAKELTAFINVPEQAVVLVIGLGNWNVTPDAIGPLVVEDLFVTRHLFSLMPEVIDEGFRSVCALAPGVLGITGIETSEIVQAIVDRLHPDLVIAIDALAARSLDRVNSTIQISDSGIQPGAGVGNRRRALNRETLGVDVIAIGVPTVVDAATIASDAMDLLLQTLENKVPGNGAGRIFGQFAPQEKRALIAEVLQPLGNNLMVTPKEIDEFVDDIAHVVAMGLNVALHPGMSMEDARELTH